MKANAFPRLARCRGGLTTGAPNSSRQNEAPFSTARGRLARFDRPSTKGAAIVGRPPVLASRKRPGWPWSGIFKCRRLADFGSSLARGRFSILLLAAALWGNSGGNLFGAADPFAE